MPLTRERAGLRTPALADLPAFTDALAEYAAHGELGPGDPLPAADTAMLRAYVESLADAPARDLQRWYFDSEGRYLGRIAFRRRMPPIVAEVHGHIAYDVRPTARGRGHATDMLRLFLDRCVAPERASVRITCRAANLASRRVIEKAGGRFVDDFAGFHRFEVPTRAP